MEKISPPIPAAQGNPESSFMADWERGSPMRAFIYYLQRAICGALVYLVVHQSVLGLRLVGLKGPTALFFEKVLAVLSIPGTIIVSTFLDPTRPLNLPPPLANFFINICFYFLSVGWLCYFFNRLSRRSFMRAERGDPFKLAPKE